MPDTKTETATYPPSEAFAASAHVGSGAYDDLYAASVSDPEGFWAEQARRVDWIK
ncbi:MAG: acetyl-coenzyme A synthetase N-terminal domain-containing protein, partial [Paracoccaceae bacterium]|nr:acetyl-coenzyme A synthetase N-terminal domain-containing protein [Paracoccaceae bacterium]